MKIPVWRGFADTLVILVGIAVALPSVMPRDITRSFPRVVPPTAVSRSLDLRGDADVAADAPILALLGGWRARGG